MTEFNYFEKDQAESAHQEAIPKQELEQRLMRAEPAKPGEPMHGKMSQRDVDQMLEDLPSWDVTDISKIESIDISKMVESTMEKLRLTEREPSSRRVTKSPLTKPTVKRSGDVQQDLSPQERSLPEQLAPKSGETVTRKHAEIVAYGRTELSKALQDLKPVEIKGKSFLEVARAINKGGDVPIVIVEGQKIFCFDPEGKTLGDLDAYWPGTIGTGRPATNLDPGTYIIDRGTLDVYSVPSGEVIGKIHFRYGARASEIIARGEKDLFLASVERAPNRHLAFRDVVKEQRLIVVRVPDEGDMMLMESDEGFKVSEAFVRSADYLEEEIAKTIRMVAKHPIMAILTTLTGQAGRALSVAEVAMRLGTATAIARSAETPDAINAAARLYASVFADIGGDLALGALTKGATGAIKAKAAKLEAGARGAKPEAKAPQVAPGRQAGTPEQVWVNTASGKIHCPGSAQWRRVESNAYRGQHWKKTTLEEAETQGFKLAEQVDPRVEQALGHQREIAALEEWISTGREQMFGKPPNRAEIVEQVVIYHRVIRDGKDFYVEFKGVLNEHKEIGRRLDVVDFTDPDSPKILEIGTRTPSPSEVRRKEDQLYIWENAHEEAEWLRSQGGDGRIYVRLKDGSYRDITNGEYIEFGLEHSSP